MPKKATLQKLPQELSLREELGLTLETLAPFCGVSVSMLGMIETKRRSWPSGSLNRIKLGTALAQVQQEESVEGELPAPSENQMEELKNRIAALEYKYGALQQDFKKMQLRYTQATQLYRVCQKLKPEFTTPGSMEVASLDLWEKQSLRKMEENSRLRQQQLSIQVDELKRRIGKLKALVG